MNRNFYPAFSLGTSRVYGEFLFTAPGASTSGNLALVDGCKIVAGIAHVGGSNVVTITFTDPVYKFIDLTAEPRDDAGTGGYCTVGTVTNEGTSNPPTFKIQYFTAAGAANNDPALVTQVLFAMKNSQWGTGVK